MEPTSATGNGRLERLCSPTLGLTGLTVNPWADSPGAFLFRPYQMQSLYRAPCRLVNVVASLRPCCCACHGHQLR